MRFKVEPDASKSKHLGMHTQTFTSVQGEPPRKMNLQLQSEEIEQHVTSLKKLHANTTKYDKLAQGRFVSEALGSEDLNPDLDCLHEMNCYMFSRN